MFYFQFYYIFYENKFRKKVKNIDELHLQNVHEQDFICRMCMSTE